jgi:hypothetical protein
MQQHFHQIIIMMLDHLIKGLTRFSWAAAFDETGNPLGMQRRLATRRMMRSAEVGLEGTGSAPKSSHDEGSALQRSS